MITRRRLLYAGGALAALSYPTLLEPRWLETTRTAVRLSKPVRETFRLLQLTDLHASWAVPFSTIDSAIREGMAAKPDVIVLTGDFITHAVDIDFQKYIRSLSRLTATGAPVLAVLGNHDGGSWARLRHGPPDQQFVRGLLDHAGIALLHNRSMERPVRGQKILFIGVGDLWSEELDAQRAFEAARSDLPVILLCHNPDGKEHCKAHSWDLMLSGHTHGGQVMIPFAGPRYAPVRDKRYVAGLRAWGERQIYTSRGVGSLGSVRFQCRPEVTLLDIAASNS